MNFQRLCLIDKHGVLHYKLPNRRKIVFCGYCAFPKRTDHLEAHCLSVHKTMKKCLRENEEPIEPFCTNWAEYIQDLDCVKPMCMWRRVSASLLKSTVITRMCVKRPKKDIQLMMRVSRASITHRGRNQWLWWTSWLWRPNRSTESHANVLGWPRLWESWEWRRS